MCFTNVSLQVYKDATFLFHLVYTTPPISSTGGMCSFLPLRFFLWQICSPEVTVSSVLFLKYAEMSKIILQLYPGPSLIKPDQLDPWIKDQLGNILLSTISPLQLRNFVSCGRACPWRDDIVESRVIFSRALIHGSSWSHLIKVGPGVTTVGM